jgi:hypothetical protein
MNPSAILTRGTHSGGQVDMHIKMHTSIRTNIFTITKLFMGMENFYVHMPYVRFDREAWGWCVATLTLTWHDASTAAWKETF